VGFRERGESFDGIQEFMTDQVFVRSVGPNIDQQPSFKLFDLLSGLEGTVAMVQGERVLRSW
jgi:hypothetical protein